MMDKIIVIGGGGHAKVVISILRKLKRYEIIGYTDNENKNLILKVPYIGTDNVLLNYFKNHEVNNAVLGLGQLKSSELRKSISEKVISIGYDFPSIISPDAIINENVKIGSGTVIMDGVIINIGTRIEKFCIINTKVSIDHDCLIGNFTHIAPGVTLSGCVEIGDNVLIGTGVNVIQYKKIVDNSMIGAGATIIESIVRPGTYVGNPAKLVFEKQVKKKDKL